MFETSMPEHTPFLSHRFDLALHLASGLHRTQCRKGTSIPYISHLMAVCAMVLEHGGD
jgi:(p)ppGpp synthase/HD superfamily hydrolase